MRMWIALLLCVACGKNEQPPPPSSGSPMAQQETGPGAKGAGAAGAMDQAKKMYATPPSVLTPRRLPR